MDYIIPGLLAFNWGLGCVCMFFFPSNPTCTFLPNEIQQIKHNTPWEDWSPLWKVRLASELASGFPDLVHLTPGSWAAVRAAVSLDQNLQHGTVFTVSDWQLLVISDIKIRKGQNQISLGSRKQSKITHILTTANNLIWMAKKKLYFHIWKEIQGMRVALGGNALIRQVLILHQK